MKLPTDSAGESHEVRLEVPTPTAQRFDRGAEILRAEFDLSAITPELLMQVCLAAAEEEELVLGFLRDDLRLVSLADQTRQMVERDRGILHASQPLSVPELAAQDAKRARHTDADLNQFIHENPETFRAVCAAPPIELARWVMLGLQREGARRRRGSQAIEAWKKTLLPAAAARLRSQSQSLKVAAPRI